jgi:PAS domain S-box-containing protein
MLEIVKKILTPNSPNFRNIQEAQAVKSRLEKQVEEHARVESRLRKAHYELLKQVEELTLELSKCREFLRHETSERKLDELLLEDYKVYAGAVTDIMWEPFVVLDSDMKVIRANRSFYRTFGLCPAEMEDRIIFEVNGNEWNIKSLREVLEDALHEKTESQEVEIDQDFPTVGRKIMRVVVRMLHRKENNSDILILAIHDVTEQKEMQEQRKNWDKNRGDSGVAPKKTRKDEPKAGQII